MITTTVGPRPGRQRSEAADEAILDGTLAVLAEQGYAGLTMAAVIERSGVSSATLYRRYTTKIEPVTPAIASPPPPPGDTGTRRVAGGPNTSTLAAGSRSGSSSSRS